MLIVFCLQCFKHVPNLEDLHILALHHNRPFLVHLKNVSEHHPSIRHLRQAGSTDSVGSLGGGDLLAVLVVSHTWWRSTVAATFS